MSSDLPPKEVNVEAEETPQQVDSASSSPAEDIKHPISEKANVDIDIEKDNTNGGQIDPTLVRHGQDEDEAMKAVEELHGEVVEIDEATNKRLLKAIDRHLMPIMCMVYAMNYLDSMWFTLFLLYMCVCQELINGDQKPPYHMPMSWEL